MFGKQDGQNQPFGDMSGVSLPGQPPAQQPAPQFASPMPPAPMGAQDFSVPEIPAHSQQPAPVTGVGISDSDLTSLKQQALSQLTPLVGHLDQTPEEKFRTTMMMIQAADDQSLIRSAYEAAQAIQDDKVRAQALLDVINEINYFSQKQSGNN